MPTALTLAGLLTASLPALTKPTTSDFDAYWNRGQAEITSYHLRQARYGEVHDGHAVLVFVTEPFSASKQVKLDNPGRTPADHVPVLKLNATRKFTTGIYPYSVMTSVFAPVRTNQVLKVTNSSQEWCGHTFQQLNRTASGWRHQLHSYFEGEGEQDATLPPGRTEDGLWTQVRLDPSALPTGTISLVPGTTFLRLRHRPPAAQPAEARVTREGKLARYTVRYQNIPRSLEIDFEPRFPYRIVAFRERGASGFGPGAASLETSGRLNRRLKIDYWNRNRRVDGRLRAELGL